jgi:parallel beta-helix repeat protein
MKTVQPGAGLLPGSVMHKRFAPGIEFGHGRFFMRGLLSVFVLLLLHQIPFLQARVIHIPGDSSTIQGGITGAVDGDTVLVDPGTYHEHDIDFLGKAVTVMGTDPEDSATVASTVVNADSAGSVFTFQTGEDSMSVLAGLTIRGGTGEWGGGIRCTSSPTIRYNTITDNHVTLGGGGISCGVSSSPKIRHNIISANSADSLGGGISCLSTRSIITNNTITGNSAGRLELGILSHGGGIACSSNDSSIISGNTIRDNSVVGEGYAKGGGIACFFGSSALISDNLVSGNSALSLGVNGSSYGGGITCYEASPSIVRNVVTDNRAVEVEPGLGNGASRGVETDSGDGIDLGYGGGGGILCQFSCSDIKGNLVADNEAPEGAGVMVNRLSTPIIENNTIVGNKASHHAGGLLCSIKVWGAVINTIFWDNHAPVGPEIYVGKVDYPSTLAIDYSDVEGGLDSVVVVEGSTIDWGDGLIDVDPVFRDRASGDFHLKTVGCGYVQDSPCIDAGIPALADTLLDCTWGLGTTRSDIGAYGGWRPAQPAYGNLR